MLGADQHAADGKVQGEPGEHTPSSHIALPVPCDAFLISARLASGLPHVSSRRGASPSG